MMKSNTQAKNGALVHWNYSPDEWKRFMRWKKRRKSLFHYILHRIWPGRGSKTPGIIITEKEVRINDTHEPFQDGHHQVKHISVREAGKVNVLQITYETVSGRLHRINDIYVLVPKGKLREAIELQERIKNEILSR